MSLLLWLRPPGGRPGRHPALKALPRLELLEERLAPAGTLVFAFPLANPDPGDTVQPQAVATDSAGNVYLTGSFSGSVTLGAATTLIAQGTQDAFVAKYTAAGALLWGADLGGGGAQLSPTALAVDGAGNVYSTGSFSGTPDFDPAGGGRTLPSSGGDNAYVSKLDGAGHYAWAGRLGAGASAVGTGLAVDGPGDVYVTGFFSGTANFDPGGSHPLSSSGGSNAYVAKLDPGGNYVWADRLGAGASTVGSAVALDGAGGVYTTGYFAGAGNFDPAGTHTLSAPGNSNAYVSKLDAAGKYVWASALGAGAAAFGRGIAVDAAGNAYTTGDFVGVGNFDPAGGSHTFASSGGFNAYVSKLDGAGHYAWAGRLGAGATTVGYAITVDGRGTVWATGEFLGTGNFDPGGGSHTLSSSGGNNTYVAQLDASGQYLSAGGLGRGADVVGYGLAVDGPGNAYAAGSFAGAGNFDPAGGATSKFTSTPPGRAGFLVKLAGRLNQTLSFPPPAAVTFHLGLMLDLTGASASSGLPVSYALLGGGSGVGTLSGGHLLLVTQPGTFVLQASQPGDATYSPAAPVVQTLTVNKAGQAITFGPLAPVTLGAAPIALSAVGGGSGNPVTFRVLSGPGTLSGNTLTVTGLGGVVIEADQAGDATYSPAAPVVQTLTVNKAGQAITFGPLAPVTLGAAPVPLTATGGGSGNPVTFRVLSGPGTLSGNTLTVTGVGGVVIEADQAGNATYSPAAPVQRTLTVLPATGSLAGRLSFDFRAGGQADPTEPGLPGLTVFVDLNGNGVPDPGEPSTITDGTGAYHFDNLPAGSYAVRLAGLPPGVAPTAPAAGAATVRVAAGQAASQDFGLLVFGPAALVPATPGLFNAYASDADTSFVKGLYQAVLGRTDAGTIPQPDGQALPEAQFWLNLLHGGMTREQVAYGFVNSAEHRRQQVASLYRAYLGRDTDPQAEYWVGLLLAGQGEGAVVQGIVASPEYQSGHPDDASFVRGLYLATLGRQASDADVSGGVARLAGGATRADLALAVLRSQESSDRAVAGFFAAYLHRAAQPNDTWSQALQTGALEPGQAAAEILGDPVNHEFYDRLSGQPTPAPA
jgi:hypothetical protein